MTYDGGGEEDGGVPELRLSFSDGRDAGMGYLKLPERDDGLVIVEGEDGDLSELAEPSTPKIRCGFLWRKWVKLALLFLFLAVVAVVSIIWVGPFVMNEEVIPIINWEMSTFSVPELAVILFFTVALFPTLLLPSSPSMWVAGMTFGYGFGFLLIISAVIIGVSLPYFLSYLFYRKIQIWLEKYPKQASIIRLAGEGDWINQFRAVVLIRISPFPYILYNYCAVATNVKYGPYFCGSMVGMVPDVFVAIYTGILIRTLADASHDHRSLSAQQIISTVLGFVATALTTIFCTVLAKRRLKKIQMEEDRLLQ